MIAGGPSIHAPEIMRLIRHALREARDLTAAIQLLADAWTGSRASSRRASCWS